MGRLKLLGEREVGGAAVAILEGDTSIVAGASALSFAPADFVVEDAGNGRANVALDYENGAMALADKSRPSPWVAAADLAERSIGDLGTRTHSLLTGLDQHDHPIYPRKAAAEDVTGLWQFSNTGQLDMAGDLKVGKGIALKGANPHADRFLRVEPVSETWTTTKYGIWVQAVTCNAGANNVIYYGVYGTPTLYLNSGVSGIRLRGLYFAAGAINNMGATATTAELCGCRTKVEGDAHVAGSHTVTAGYNFYAESPTALDYGGGLTWTDHYGLYIANQGNAKIANAYGIRIADITGSTTNRILELGPTPYLRLLGSGDWTPAANETPLYLAEGATPTLRQVRWKAGNALGAGDKVLVLV